VYVEPNARQISGEGHMGMRQARSRQGDLGAKKKERKAVLMPPLAGIHGVHTHPHLYLREICKTS
jgi:hypothetical protein